MEQNMTMLKFTNNSERYKGNPVYINSECIISIFEEPTDGGSLATVIFGGFGPPQKWTVEEGLSEVIKIINEVK